MKKCKKCGEIKELCNFYTHKQMKDGHLNKCIDCCKKEAKNTRKKNLDILGWTEQENERTRQRYHRLNYREKYPYTYNKYTKKWREQYPEKHKAEIAAQRLECKKGFEKHHWSYRSEHHKDVIIVTIEDHNKYHRYTIYDQEQQMYRTLDGVLLDTKDAYIKYVTRKEER